jgi:hypothetical protein
MGKKKRVVTPTTLFEIYGAHKSKGGPFSEAKVEVLSPT